ncbi:MAG: hypothetical protein JWL92_397 [Candidatus Nomurabacteria bacterium]|nr:hypothetical protein [Candidatus Nomurabacteria bacterium]
MFKLSKKYKTIDLYPDTWDVSDATLKGDAFIIRVCTGLKEAIGHPDYSYQIGIAVPLNWETETGIMSNAESESLKEIEDQIEKKIESKNTRLVGILTGRNMREFILYTSEPKIAEEKLEILKNEVDSHKIQFIIQHDPEWNTYKFMIER